MPLLQKKPAGPHPDLVYLAWDSFAWADEVVAKGERLRGSSPVVQAVFSMFVQDGTPRNEWPTPFDHVLSAAELERAERRAAEKAATDAAAKLNKIKLTVADVMVAKQDFVSWRNAQPATILKGSQVLADDELVARHPDQWVKR